jgi:diaminopimelate epimerase
MKIPFTKMHGAGNDFIVVDDRAQKFPVADVEFCRRMAARRTGIGCDGILLIQPSETADFRMRFINPDGHEVEMCGNGARCIARLAYDLKIAPGQMSIETAAGTVGAKVEGKLVCLDLTVPSGLQLNLALNLDWPVDFIDTGVPHAVLWVERVGSVDLPRIGRLVREHERFSPNGTNVNFAQVEADGSLSMRTYERGVEGETMACGTGAAAVALLAAERGWISLPVSVHCAGGHDLVIDSRREETLLTGGAEYVYNGEIEYGGSRL